MEVDLEVLPRGTEGDPTSPMSSSRAGSEAEEREGGRALGLLSRWAMRSRWAAQSCTDAVDVF